MNKELIRKIVRITTLSIVGTYLTFCVYFFLTHPAHPKYLDCGKVVSKSQDEVVIKYGTRTELFLNVQFKKTGFKAVEVNATDYFGTKKERQYVLTFVNM